MSYSWHKWRCWMKSVPQLRTMYWSWKLRGKMVERNRKMMTEVKIGDRSWLYASTGEPTHTIKDTCTICRIHTWMEATTTPELFMRCTTSSEDVKRKHQLMASRVMVCHLHKVGSSRTHQIFAVIVVNK